MSLDDAHEQLQVAHLLWRQYRPEAAPYRFKAGGSAEAARWQTETRDLLAKAVGFQDLPAVPFEAQPLERIDKGDYVREKILLRKAKHRSCRSIC